jgi:hypothetical protein
MFVVVGLAPIRDRTLQKLLKRMLPFVKMPSPVLSHPKSQAPNAATLKFARW